MLEVVELFCGAGGMSLGLAQAGLRVRLGVDCNRHCTATYLRNFRDAKALTQDIATIRACDILAAVSSREQLVLAGCPPCQPFSQLHRSNTRELPEFEHYLRLLWSLRPAWIVFENVPRIRLWSSLWERCLQRLSRMGYYIETKVVDAADFRVPQRRKRLILVGTRRPFALKWPSRQAPRTVRDAIESLQSNVRVRNHVSMTLSPTNLARIQKISLDGGCSKAEAAPFADSYGRMAWDEPAPTVTTKCISFSNGRFGHPVLDRAITVREAARLQGFPNQFVFMGPLKETARQVGNAVPPPIAKWIGRQILLNHGLESSS